MAYLTALQGARAAVSHVVEHMREWDRREIFATRWNDDNDAMVDDVLTVAANRGLGWVAWADGEPVAAIGVMSYWPGVSSPWCFGTDKFRRASLLLTRTAKQTILPAVRAFGCHRLEVKTLDGHLEAQRWLEVCFGAKREATHEGYGRKGETFHTYVLRL